MAEEATLQTALLECEQLFAKLLITTDLGQLSSTCVANQDTLSTRLWNRWLDKEAASYGDPRADYSSDDERYWE